MAGPARSIAPRPKGRPGEVLVLSAVGLQAQDWRSVSPAALFHIVNALRVVGLGSTARMGRGRGRDSGLMAATAFKTVR